MIEEHAIVISVDEQSAWLEIERRAPCGLCGKTRGCGISLLGKLFKHRSHRFKVENLIQAKVGQSVVVGIQPDALLKTALFLYGIPLIGVLVGAVAAATLAPSPSDSDMYSMIGALIGFLASLLWLKAHRTGGGFDADNQPAILRIDDQKIIHLTCERSV